MTTRPLARRLRIVHVYKDIYPVLGGMENHVRLLCRELARDPRLDVRILATSPSSSSSVSSLDGVPVTRTGRVATVASTPLSPRLPFELRRVRPESCICTFHTRGRDCRAPCRAGRADRDHLPERRGQAADLARALRPAAQARVAPSRAHPGDQRGISGIIGLAPARAGNCRLVPLGIDLRPFLPIERVSDGRTLLFVGRFRYYKGLRYLVDAMPNVPGATLLLVGSGPMEANLRQQVAALELTERVRFISGVDDHELPGYYQRADVLSCRQVNKARRLASYWSRHVHPACHASAPSYQPALVM